MTLLYPLSSLLMAQAEAAPGDAGPMGGLNLPNVLPLVLMFGVLYVLLLRPASKQRKEHQTLLASLKKDDEVLTSSGMYGRILSLDERIVTLEIADKVKVRMLRDRIAGPWNAGNTGASSQAATAQK